MAKKMTKSRKTNSVFVSAVNRFTAFIYSLFIRNRACRAMSNETSIYEKSYFGKLLEKSTKKKSKNSAGFAEIVVEKSFVFRIMNIVKGFLLSLSLNVYGAFFAIYGLTSVLMYYVSIAIYSKHYVGEYAVLTSIIIILCSLPLLATSKSIVAAVEESRFVRAFALSFLGIPEEKMKAKGQIDGIEIIFFSGILAILFGIFTYFLHPAYLLVACGLILTVSLCLSTPESGVVLTITFAPFLQYTEYSRIILVGMILLVMFSYLCKLIRRRRTTSFGAIGIIFLIFCAFVFVTSIFSKGGSASILDGLISVIIIFGGFFLTYNLVKGQKRLDTCMGILLLSFVLICISGLWNVFYNAIGDGATYSISESVRPIFEYNVLYISDSASVFGVMSVMLFPFVLAYMAGQKSFKGSMLSLTTVALCVVTTFVYGTYEAVVIIGIEFCAFWILHSHKTLSALIFASIPVAIIAVIYPYAKAYWGFEGVGDIVSRILPMNDLDSSAHIEVSRGVLEMLKDSRFLGIGSGERAFVSAFADYQNAISSGVTSPTSFYLQLICWSGIGGLITFVILMILIVGNSLGYISISKDKDIRRKSLALLCGAIGLLLFGFVNSIWNDARMLYLFWACLGLLSGYVKEGKDRQRNIKSELYESESSADIRLKVE